MNGSYTVVRVVAMEAVSRMGGLQFGGTRSATAVVVASLFALTSCSDPSLGDTEREESGEIAEEGNVGVQRLQLGDCLVLPESMLTLATAEESVELTEMQACRAPRHTTVKWY